MVCTLPVILVLCDGVVGLFGFPGIKFGTDATCNAVPAVANVVVAAGVAFIGD